MSRPRFPPHLLAASDSSPIRVRILQQVHGSCLYVLCPHRQFCLFACSQFYSLILRPGTSACFFSLACLSFMVAGTPEHQCLLFVFVLVCSCRDTVAHHRPCPSIVTLSSHCLSVTVPSSSHCLSITVPSLSRRLFVNVFSLSHCPPVVPSPLFHHCTPPFLLTLLFSSVYGSTFIY